MIAPTSVSSRFSARPVIPFPKSSISFNIAPVRPSIFSTPSPISRTVPTFCLAVSVLTPAIWASISCNKVLIWKKWSVGFKNFPAVQPIGPGRCHRKHRCQLLCARRRATEGFARTKCRGLCRTTAQGWSEFASANPTPVARRFRRVQCALQYPVSPIGENASESLSIHGASFEALVEQPGERGFLPATRPPRNCGTILSLLVALVWCTSCCDLLPGPFRQPTLSIPSQNLAGHGRCRLNDSDRDRQDFDTR